MGHDEVSAKQEEPVSTINLGELSQEEAALLALGLYVLPHGDLSGQEFDTLTKLYERIGKLATEAGMKLFPEKG